jgi:hypothetical protein
MSFDEARKRNALPVPADQYGNPGAGGTYDYFDVVNVTPPDGWNSDSDYVEVDLKYQPTSWEYVQFLWLANNGGNAFLADEGDFLLEAWLNTETAMAAPYVMASTTWGNAPTPAVPEMFTDSLTTFRAGKRGQVVPTNIFKTQDNFLLEANVVDELGASLSGAQVFVDILLGTTVVATLQGFSDSNGLAELQWKIPRRQEPGDYTANVTNIIKSGYTYPLGSGVAEVDFTIQ